MDPRYSLTGLLVGFLVGLTGMGGGSLMTPLLILLLRVKPHLAVGSDLAYSAITKMVGGFQHHRQQTVDYRLAWRLSIGSVPGSLLGVWLVHRLQQFMGEDVQKLIVRMLGVMLILVAVSLFAKSNPRVNEWGKRLHVAKGSRELPWAIGIGLAFGFLVGVTSVGSGSLFGVALLVIFGLTPKDMVGTDVFQAAILTSAAAGGHILAGNVDYTLVGNLLLGSIPGVLLGSRLAVKLPENALRPVLASILLLCGGQLMR